MKILCCPSCKGAGFRRVPKNRTYPEFNVAGARLIRERIAPTGDELYDYYRSIVAYEWDCEKCRGNGEIQWQRGRSLTPKVGS